MFGDEFDHDLMQKYTALFGTLFNKIYISRDGTQKIKVPLAYGPREKFEGRAGNESGDPDAKRDTAIRLPRMSFEIPSITPDRGRRGLSKLNTIIQPNTVAGRSVHQKVWQPVPYIINFQLNIIAKTLKDGNKILGQILPYFTPNLSLTAQLVEGMPNTIFDIPIVLQSVTPTDTWEGDFKTRRTLTWTLDFVMDAWFFGPVAKQGVIKKVFVNLYPSLTSTTVLDRITIQPGLTANGEPTTDIDETIPYQQIEETDDWAYIIQIENLPEDDE